MPRPETGALTVWAVELIDMADSYIEVTPSGTGVRTIGTTGVDAREVHRKFRVVGAADGAAIEVYRRATRYITVTCSPVEESAAELQNIDHVIDAVVARYDRRKGTGTNGAGFDFERQDTRDDIDNLIKNGAPIGQRSEAFSKVVWSLAATGSTVDEIEVRLAKHPNGIAAKFIDRLRAEIERSYEKWQAHSHRPHAGSNDAQSQPGKQSNTNIELHWHGEANFCSACP